MSARGITDELVRQVADDLRARYSEDRAETPRGRGGKRPEAAAKTSS
ncbi:MAG: hypothetical protein ACXVHB_34090 [Solirubrobacteraceae bacterium]